MESTVDRPRTLQKIPIAQIKPNPDNPRHVISPEMVDSLAASIQAVGLNNPLKVQALPDGGYRVISGHIRLAALQKLGWAEAPALVVELTPEQALLEAILDNRGQPMNWLDWYQSIESLWNATKDPTQRGVADRLGVSPMTVNRALKVTKLLNPAARQALVTDCYKNPDADPLSEGCVRALTDLGDSQKVEEALKVALERRMTEAQAKKLVGWVKAGNRPEDYNPDKPKAAEPPRHQGHQESQTDEVALKPEPPVSASTTPPLKKGEQKGVLVSEAQPTSTPTVHAQIGSLIAGKELAKRLHLPAQALNGLLPTFARHFQRVIGLFEWLGVKNRVAATIISLFLILFVGSTLIGWSNRLIGWLVSSLVNSGPR